MTEVHELAADLRAEQEDLDRVVSELGDEQWELDTPSAGWTVADQVGHLTYFDGAAATAITDPDAFTASIEELRASEDGGAALTLYRYLAPAELLAAWRGNRERLAAAAATLTDGMRVPWYGPSMGAKSFLTARLMECWAHGQDVVDALASVRAPTDRLRHIAQLGHITRGWSYLNRGMEVPAGDVRLELTGPSGAMWGYGPDDATEVVTGPALDFCLVVTQRRHVDDTALRVTGELARDWLEKAQAFAGRPTDGPAPSAA
jgi:uncharacterized protein (TIGR03084 family)